MICRTEPPGVHPAKVVGTTRLCKDHHRIAVRVDGFGAAMPGQFVHLSPLRAAPPAYRIHAGEAYAPSALWRHECLSPLLRRAYSIAGVRSGPRGAELDVIYRVVGTGTRWLASLSPGDTVSVLGPLGNHFPISESKRHAWLVAGGVGLPPMLWLAESLHRAGKGTVAFCGATSGELLALTMTPGVSPCSGAREPRLCCEEFASQNVPVVLSTDDGSVGFRGQVGEAMCAYHDANALSPQGLVVYTCGPEPMMRFVAAYCVERQIECYVCMERSMACGTGLCQSCVVPVRAMTDAQGWLYKLCCADGPIFNAGDVVWEPVKAG